MCHGSEIAVFSPRRNHRNTCWHANSTRSYHSSTSRERMCDATSKRTSSHLFDGAVWRGKWSQTRVSGYVSYLCVDIPLPQAKSLEKWIEKAKEWGQNNNSTSELCSSSALLLLLFFSTRKQHALGRLDSITPAAVYCTGRQTTSHK